MARSGIRVLPFAVLLVGAFGSGATAHALNSGHPWRVHYPYNVAVYEANLVALGGTQWRPALEYMVRDYDATSMVAHWEPNGLFQATQVDFWAISEPRDSTIGFTDPFAFDVELGKWISCRKPPTGHECTSTHNLVEYARVEINVANRVFQRDPNDYYVKRHMVTHETGHAVGLKHYGGCTAGVMGGFNCNPLVWKLDAYSKQHLDAWY